MLNCRVNKMDRFVLLQGLNVNPVTPILMIDRSARVAYGYDLRLADLHCSFLWVRCLPKQYNYLCGFIFIGDLTLNLMIPITKVVCEIACMV